MKIETTILSIAVSTLILMFALTGCAGVSGNSKVDPEQYYAQKAQREARCAKDAHHQYPGYPSRRGIVSNFWFTQAYDHCLEQKATH